MSKKRKQYDDDDGRTIVNMDVPGTRWYQENDPARLREESSSQSDSRRPRRPIVELTRKEVRQITWSALLAGLTIALVFSVTWILFTLFATQIWFK
ncbi:MAG: UbiA prenyltransferase family protein [Anaerolineaceae bacterium]|nr:UbiA prenyltransferase family protein [Anaerolineaceae bacterium]